MTYPGGKNGMGVYQRIINHMPPHQTYIEGFCGSGAILRQKKPADRNIAIDKSQDALDLCASLHNDARYVDFVRADTLDILYTLANIGNVDAFIDDPKVLIYLDPPYLPETRKGGDLYTFEMTIEDHKELLQTISDRPSMIMISGYRSALYDEFLSHWHCIDYRTMTRRGMVDEALWINFAPPIALHDYGHLGSDFRQRERIKRKKVRWRNKLNNMDRLERLAIMDALEGFAG